MNNIASSALNGLRVESYRLGNAANNVANLNTPGFHARRVVQSEGPGDTITLSTTTAPPDQNSGNSGPDAASDVDLVTESVDLLTAKNGFAMNTKVLKAANEMTKSLLDIMA